ncbi:MAG: DUF4143 domain-containing protein [Micrococcales bacterium]|nr:DUF4143 domain-containing protein [Micrococcales bacterium]
MSDPAGGWSGTSLPRAIEQYLEPDQSVKVKVLEGALAAGKTTVAWRLVEAGAYDELIDLANPNTLARAREDIRFFVENLGRRAVVDEAQLLGDELSLAVKDVVDRPGSERRFLLTGSARIGRTGLGGADPLAGRVERWTLDPFSACEVRGDPEALTSMIDGLFGEVPSTNSGRSWDTKLPSDWMKTGGMPPWSLGSLADARRQKLAGDWRDGVLTEHVLPGEGRWDLAVARTVLDGLLRGAATNLNVTSMAERLDLDPRTANRYIDVLERRFQVRFLPNLSLGPARQTRRNAKVHPVDLSLVRQSLAKANPEGLNQPETIGRLFETWVVNQALAGRPFAKQPTEAYSWRTSRGSHEVDLVLVSSDGRRVGLEAKSSTTIHPADSRGLRALEAEPGGLHAGYVVYPGSALIRLGERIWALPVQAFLEGWTSPAQPISTPASDRRPVKMTHAGKEAPDPPAASLFVSYVHEDDAYLDKAITDFAADLAEAYHFAYGRRLDVFTDLALRWGEDWQKRLDQEVEQTAFFLANVTPRYLGSPQCRDEIVKFDAAATKAGEPRLVLPVFWQPVEGLAAADPQDPVYRLVTTAQYQVATDLPSLQRGSATYRQRTEELAARLHDTIAARERSGPAAPPSAGPPVEAPDFFDAVEQLEPAAGEFAEALEEVLGSVGLVFDDLGAGGPNAAVVSRHRTRLDPAVKRLNHAKTNLVSVWNAVADPLRGLTGNRQTRSQLNIEALRTQLLSLASVDLPELSQIVDPLQGISKLSRQLRPSMQAIINAIRAIDAIRTQAQAWADEL